MDVSMKGLRLEAVELGDVAARDLEPVVRARVLEISGDHVLGMWPRRSLMGVVGGPHHPIHPDEMAIGHPDVVVNIGAVHLALKVLAGLQLDLEPGGVTSP